MGARRVNRVAALLGNPEVDPHGAPIPTPEGVIDETVYRPLSELAVGACARVVA